MGKCQNLLRLSPTNSPRFPPISNSLPFILIKISCVANLSNVLQSISAQYVSIFRCSWRENCDACRFATISGWCEWKQQQCSLFCIFLQPLLCNQLLQIDQNQNGQQVGLKVSSHERFKHTFYPALSNQDSYANSISDCLARDSFGNKISKERQSKTNMDRKINFWFVWFYLDKITGWWTYRICMIWCFKALFFFGKWAIGRDGINIWMDEYWVNHVLRGRDALLKHPSILTILLHMDHIAIWLLTQKQG